MQIQRRHFLIFTSGALTSSAMTLAGCGANGTVSPSLSSAVTSAQTITDAFLLEAPLINAAFPNIVSAQTLLTLTNPGGTGFLDLAKSSLVLLAADMQKGIPDTAGATALDQIEGYLNQAIAAASPILTAVCTVDARCADVQATYRAIVLAVPLIELFINSVKPAAPIASAKIAKTRASSVPTHGAPQMTPDQALTVLHARLGR